MQIVIFRHGIATNRLDPDCPPDPERPLTEKGRDRTERAARGLRVLGVKPHIVLSSPYLRAVQTAKIAARVLGVRKEDVILTDDLLPESHPEKFFSDLQRFEERDIMCCGHAPNVDRLISHAIGMGDRPVTSLKKAGAAGIEMEESNRCGWLAWVMEPRALRRLGRA